MKKMLWGAMLLLMSCSPSDKRLIEKSFMNYVEYNFDDPRSIKEIVSIEPCDTVSTQNSVKLVQGLLDITEKAKSIKDSIRNAHIMGLESLLRSSRTVDISDRIAIQSLVNHSLELVEEETDVIVNRHMIEEQLIKFIDTVKYEPPVYGYTIKFRQDKGGELVLNEHYGYIDSLSREIIIKPVKWQIADLDEPMQTFTNLSSEYADIIKRESEIDALLFDNLQKLKLIIE